MKNHYARAKRERAIAEAEYTRAKSEQDELLWLAKERYEAECQAIDKQVTEAFKAYMKASDNERRQFEKKHDIPPLKDS